MSGNELVECAICGSQFRRDEVHECLAKEPLDGSPLESVVHGRQDSPAPSNPDRSGDANILAQLRARAIAARDAGFAEMAKYPKNTIFHYGQYCYAHALREVLQWIDDLAEPINNTAPDTKSSIAGVP